VPLATPSEIAATPREHAEAEFLAIRATRTFVAPQPVYDRIVADLARIRATFPEVVGSHHHPPPPELRVQLTEQGCPLFDLPEHPELRCLNEYYGGRRQCDLSPTSAFITIELEGAYSLPRLADQYGRADGVLSAHSWFVSGQDGPKVCVAIDGVAYHYLFHDGWGDCPNGCLHHDHYYFRVASPQGAIDTDRVLDGDDRVPDWVGRFEGTCEIRLTWR
jgi:hypothetical protein